MLTPLVVPTFIKLGKTTLHLVDVNGLHINIMWFPGYFAQTRLIRWLASEAQVNAQQPTSFLPDPKLRMACSKL
ncbi:MAG: hypothetical protein JO232_17720 [Verrucomicrobia bacterium]|nr:hypothetical protein [Verrucomicrobiota bacterium]